jgi:hypothetical protein
LLPSTSKNFSFCDCAGDEIIRRKSWTKVGYGKVIGDVFGSVYHVRVPASSWHKRNLRLPQELRSLPETKLVGRRTKLICSVLCMMEIRLCEEIGRRETERNRTKSAPIVDMNVSGKIASWRRKKHMSDT